MRQFFLTIFILSLFQMASAQTGTISGEVRDSKNVAISFASIYVIKSIDSSNVMGGVTTELGGFIIQSLAYNSYLVRIKVIGFIDKWYKVELKEVKPSIDLGKIILTDAGKNLKEVEVGAERKLLENSIDKKTFQVDKSIISQTGSAVDALEQLPNITIDENGNLSMRGAEGILILINGKPTGITGSNLQTILKQIPANSIDKIEVITNPSSKYDAEGANGIINIILKRNKNAGITSNLNFQAGTGDKYNLSAGLTYNKKKLGLTATYGYRNNLMWWKGHLHREVLFPDTNYFFNTDNHGTNHNISHAVSLGSDYYFDKYNTLSVTGSGTFGKTNNPEYIAYTEMNAKKDTSAFFHRHNEITGQNRFYNINSQYRKTFEKSKKEWSLSASYTKNKDTSTNNGKNQYSIIDYLPGDSAAVNRQNRNKSKSNNILLQGDYMLPLTKERKIEAGLKTAFRNYDNEMRISQHNDGSNEWKLDSTLSNRFYYSEIINAGYFNFSGVYKDFGYQAGGRVEQTIADGELKYTKQPVGYKRVDFFPSFYLLRKVKKVHEWKVNYTRRIERPSAGQLNPFSDLSDPRNIRTGNPNLKPQFISSYELEYTFANKKIMTNPGFYYKQINDLIWRYIIINEGVNYVTFANLGTAYNYGLDWITTYNPTKWVNTLTSINVYRNRMTGQLGTFVFDNTNIMANIKQTVNFKIKKIGDIQFTYNYRSPFLSPQGIGITMQWLDMGASIPVLKSKGTVTLTLSDIFDTRQFGMILSMPNVNQDFIRKMESRIFYVGFNYRFGKSTAPPKPKKKDQPEQRNDDGGF